MSPDQMVKELIDWWNKRTQLFVLINKDPYVFVNKVGGRCWHICDVWETHNRIFKERYVQGKRTDKRFFEMMVRGKCIGCGFTPEEPLKSTLAIIRNKSKLKLP